MLVAREALEHAFGLADLLLQTVMAREDLAVLRLHAGDLLLQLGNLALLLERADRRTLQGSSGDRTIGAEHLALERHHGEPLPRAAEGQGARRGEIAGDHHTAEQ